jgi:hypothetical protein
MFMFTASFYFLGVSASLLAALIFLTRGKRAGKRAEVDLDTLHAAAVCLPTGRRASEEIMSSAMFKELSWEEKAKLSDLKSFWFHWYDRCKKKALVKQKALYSWARTMALCSALCIIGVCLEAEFNQPITLQNILNGFRRPTPPASSVEADHCQTLEKESALATKPSS